MSASSFLPAATRSRKGWSTLFSGFRVYSPAEVHRIRGVWGSCYTMPKAIFHQFKGDIEFLRFRVYELSRGG